MWPDRCGVSEGRRWLPSPSSLTRQDGLVQSLNDIETILFGMDSKLKLAKRLAKDIDDAELFAFATADGLDGHVLNLKPRLG